MKKLVIAALVAALAPAAWAQGTIIKLGTLAPQNSAWHELLKELARRWEQGSSGQVKLRVYAGGVQGSEGEMVRKMGVNQLQAAAITNIGLHDIVPEPAGLSVPTLFDTPAEAECVFQRVRPKLEASLEQHGYAVLQWSRVGQARLFCDRPFATPQQMQAAGAKIFAWEGDPKTVDAFRAAGFKPVVLSSADVLPSLQTGMIDCIATVPLYALTARLFEKASRMMDMSWGYVYGATVVRKPVWDKVSPDLKPKLLDVAHQLGAQLDEKVRKLNEDAVGAMQKQGLQVVPVDAPAWRAAFEKAFPVIRGGVVPAQFFDDVIQARDGCRAAASGR